MSALHLGDVLRYEPAPRFPGQTDTRWCREGIAIVERRGAELVAFDTYWSSDRHMLTEAELATAEVLFNVAEYDELDQYQPHASRATWEKYAPADRQVVTSQHGLQRRWFVRKGASQDLATQVQNARERLADAEVEMESARRSVERRRQELAEIQAKAWAVTS